MELEQGGWCQNPDGSGEAGKECDSLHFFQSVEDIRRFIRILYGLSKKYAKIFSFILTHLGIILLRFKFVYLETAASLSILDLMKMI